MSVISLLKLSIELPMGNSDIMIPLVCVYIYIYIYKMTCDIYKGIANDIFINFFNIFILSANLLVVTDDINFIASSFINFQWKLLNAISIDYY